MKFTADTNYQKLFGLSSNPCYNDTLEAFYAITLDGDVGQAFYQVSKSENNYLKVEKYDPSTREISGSFSATYVIDSNYLNSGSVDTVKVTNGKFYTKILN